MIDIEYADYQHGNQVSFDNDMIKDWVKRLPISLNDDAINSQYGLIEALLFEGEYMPCLRRNGNSEFTGYDWTDTGFPNYTPIAHPRRVSLGLKGEANKIILNKKDITEKMKKRYEEFLDLCGELQKRDELGAIWYYWKGSKL